MKSLIKIGYILCILIVANTACQEDWLDEQPLDKLSEESFWNSEKEAKLALMGVYRASEPGENAYSNRLKILTQSASGDGGYKGGGVGHFKNGYFLYPTESQLVVAMWNLFYTSIFRCNYFLENIDRVDMDPAKRSEYIAEVKFLRADAYFWMLQWWGDVPLITKVLSVDEANNQTRNSRDEIVDFTLAELTSSAIDLPASRPDGERGRIIKSAALTLKGRLLMIEKRWPEAASVFKEIIDLNVHIIDPRYKKLFEEEGETSKEIILSTNCIVGNYPNSQNQRNYHPDFYGGYNEINLWQDLIDDYWMTDGLSIDESPLYDPDQPFENRDPRLYATVFLPEYTVFNGRLYLAHPELTNSGIKSLPGATGYGLKKYVTDNFEGDAAKSGDDIIRIRYAEVLLGYLESKLEAGDNITQDLLDQTINQLRRRQEVNIAPVSETSPQKLREIIRRERRIEFALERYIRYMDIRRWGIAKQVNEKKCYGMKLTDDPANYTDFVVNEKGHLFVMDKTDPYPWDAFWPIPQTELDINPNLGQNPGY